MHINLRELGTQKQVARVTVALWVIWAQTALLVLVGTEVGGEWSRAIVLGLLILAGIGTLLVGMAQTCIPMHEAWQKGWDACERRQADGGASTVRELPVQRCPTINLR